MAIDLPSMSRWIMTCHVQQYFRILQADLSAYNSTLQTLSIKAMAAAHPVQEG